MREQIVAKLTNFGLSINEAKTYVTLLQLGTSSASEISQQSGLPQPKIYGYLNALVSRNFAFVSDIDGKAKSYRAANPEFVIAELQEKVKSDFAFLEEELSHLIPDEDQISEKRFYAITEGYQAIYRNIEHSVKSAERNIIVLSHGSYEKFLERLKKKYAKKFIKHNYLKVPPIMDMILKTRFAEIMENYRPMIVIVDIDDENQNYSSILIASGIMAKEGINEPVMVEITHPVVTRFQFLLMEAASDFLKLMSDPSQFQNLLG